MSWTVIGHERVVRTLQRAVASETSAHAYLVTGAARIGKRTLGREMAAALNCEDVPSQRPCHHCRTCRMIAQEAHPDLIVVERSGDSALKVADVREARATIYQRPYEARYKVYLIADIDTMSEQTYNVLLLALEEPPPQVVFLLTASQADAVAPTVLSRCRLLPLQPVPVVPLAQGLQALYGATPDEARRLAALSDGRVGWAVEALAQPDLVAQRATAVAQVVALSDPDKPHSERLLLAGDLCKGENFLESRARCLRVLDDMQVWWRDLLLVATQSPAPLIHDERRSELDRQVQRRGRGRVVRGLRLIEMTAGAVERNVTPRLALEALILRL